MRAVRIEGVISWRLTSSESKGKENTGGEQRLCASESKGKEKHFFFFFLKEKTESEDI
jgi:hypothetical protein